MYQDAALILSAEKKFSEFGFPEFMNIDIDAAQAALPAADGCVCGRPASHPDNCNRPDRKSTRLNSSHIQKSRMPSSA